MGARMRLTGGMWGAGFLGLALLTLAGCKQNCGSQGCCQSQNRADVPALPRRLDVVPEAAVAGPAATAAAPAANKLYGGQKTCPVTGEELGSMGPAVPVTVQGETVYVCCPGCAAKVKRDTDGYLAKVRAERAGP